MLNALLWNLVLTTGLAIGLTALCRLPSMRRRPALRHWLWLLLLVKLVTPPLIAVPLLPAVAGSHDTVAMPTPSNKPTGHPESALDQRAQANPAVEDTTSALVDEGAGRDVSGVTSRELRSGTQLPYLGGLFAASLIGTCVLLTVHGVHAAKLYRWLKRAGTESSLLAKTCAEVASRLGIRGVVRNCAVDARTVPLLWGWRRPLVVAPRQLIEDLSPQQLRSIVAHELAHYVRRDHWANTLALLVKLLIWWDPVVWWAHREMRAAQELCCDAIAIDQTKINRHCYATTLLKALDFVQAEPFAFPELALPMGSRRPILRRFEMIGNAQVSYRLSRWTLLILLASVIPLVCFPVRSQGQGTPAATTPSLEEIEAGASPEEPPQLVAFSVPVAATSTIVTTLQPQVPNARLTLDAKSKRLIVWATPAELEIVRKALERLAQGETEEISSDAGAATDSTDTRNEKVAKANEKELPMADEKAARSDEKAGEAKQARVIEAYSFRELDPQTVLMLLETLMAERPEVRMTVDLGESHPVRMTVDPQTRKLVLWASPDDHATVRATLEKIRPQAAETPKPDAKRPRGTEAKPQDERKLRFAFRYQKWDDVLQWYAEAAGLSLVIDNPVPGTFNYTDAREFTVTESMDLLNSVLLTKGYALVRRDRMLMVVSAADGIPPDLVPRVTIEELGRRGRFELVSVMFPLGRRDAEQVRAGIAPLLGTFGSAVVLPQTHQLLVIERAGIIRDINAIIESIPGPEP